MQDSIFHGLNWNSGWHRSRISPTAGDLSLVMVLVHCDNYLTQVILLGIDLKSLRPLTIVGILCLHITLVHLAFFLGATGFPDGLEY